MHGWQLIRNLIQFGYFTSKEEDKAIYFGRKRKGRIEIERQFLDSGVQYREMGKKHLKRMLVRQLSKERKSQTRRSKQGTEECSEGIWECFDYERNG